MILELPFVLLIQPDKLRVQHEVPMHGLHLGSLYYLVKLRCDCLVSGLSSICFSEVSSHLCGEAFLDCLIFEVQELDLMVYSREFPAYYLDPRC